MVIGLFFLYMLDFKKVASILKKLLKINLIALTIDLEILNMEGQHLKLKSLKTSQSRIYDERAIMASRTKFLWKILKNI